MPESQARPRNIELTVEYSGTRFAGWQIQPDHRTVAGEVQRAIAEITREEVKLVAASRTDAGVHALGQVASFHTSSDMEPRRLRRALNAMLPTGDVAIRRLREVPQDFHARFSARGKHYHYRILNTDEARPLEADRSWHFPQRLDLHAMEAAAVHLEGEQDFSALATRLDGERSCVRTLHEVRVAREASLLDDGETSLVTVDVTGDAFLYKMVRTIVGTLCLVGQGKLDPGDLVPILRSGQRQQAGPVAPPQGLFLVRVFYEGDALTPHGFEGLENEDHRNRTRDSGSGQRQGVRGAEGREAGALR